MFPMLYKIQDSLVDVKGSSNFPFPIDCQPVQYGNLVGVARFRIRLIVVEPCDT